MTVSQAVIEELKRIIQDSEITKYVSALCSMLVHSLCVGADVAVAMRAWFREDDKEWPEPDRVGRQELEIIFDDEHISFTVRIVCAPKLAR